MKNPAPGPTTAPTTACTTEPRTPGAPVPGALPETTFDDNQQLLRAVSERLRQAAAAAATACGPGCASACAMGCAPASLPPEPAPACDGELERLRHIVLESATALECLGSNLADTGHGPPHGLLQQLDRTREELAFTRDQEHRALHLALHDTLTELPNRRYLGNRLRTALRATPSSPVALALLFIDLDDFKQVNDAHGHAQGDELLRVVAARLRHAVRGEDIVCRLGGDEFVLLLPSLLSRAQLVRLARQLMSTISEPVNLGGTRVVVRPSIGIALYPLDGQTPQTLLDKADTAMYQAKRSRSGFAFHEQAALA